MLTNAGADINNASIYGFTPLHMACWEGHLPIAQFLIEQGAAIDKTNHSGRLPLQYAAERGHLDVVQVLFENSTCAHINYN
jgi:ankyrin